MALSASRRTNCDAAAVSAVYPVRTGIPFLGFVVYPEHRRLARTNGVRFARRWRRMLDRYAAGRLARGPMQDTLRAWIAHASHADTWGLRRALISSQPVRVPRPR